MNEPEKEIVIVTEEITIEDGKVVAEIEEMEILREEKLKHPKTHDHKYEIIANGREKYWDKDTISYEELVELTHPHHKPDPNVRFTVKYTHGELPHPKGSLTEGEHVKVKNCMVFHVRKTNKS